MKFKKLLSGIAVLLLGLGSSLHAQKSLNSSGGDAQGSGGTSSYSIGQVVYTTASGNNGSSLQGVQQPIEIFTVGKEDILLDIDLTVFPNPTANKVQLSVESFSSGSLFYILYDVHGKELFNSSISSNTTEISLENFPSSTYLLKVNYEGRNIQTFRIIKN